MSLPRYAEYKDSGVEWLGRVPSYWQVHQARRLFAQRRDCSLPGDEQLSATQKYGVIPQRLFMEQEDQKVVLALSGLENFKRVQPDDFVISLRSFQGGIERSRYKGCVSPAYTVLRPASGLVARFWEYLLKSSPYIAALQTTTDGIRDGKNINYTQFGALPVPLPPADEQTTIAAFLDRETTKIDALIAEQEKLIALLAETRQATISHAVTRGLNPDAPMKDSGVAWLGEVPAHWETCLLKRAFSSTEYGISNQLDSDSAVAVLRMGNVSDGKIIFDNLKFVDSVEPTLLIQAGDLLFNRTNSLDLIGKVGLVAQQPDTPTSFASYLVRIRLQKGFDGRFFAYLLNTSGVLGEARARALVAIGQCNLNPNRYGMIPVAIPPSAEQEVIASYLDFETAKLDALRLKVIHAIALLTERRTALITAAVTGQIDVRGAVAAPVQQAAIPA